MLGRKKQTKESLPHKKEKKKIKIDKTIQELLPHAVYDQKLQAYLLKNGTYMDFIQIQTKDLVNASDVDVEYDSLKLEKLFKVVGEDMKLIALNFPSDTKKQTLYFEHKIQTCKNNIYLAFLKRKKEELVWLGKNTTSREFLLMIFAKNPDEMEKLRLTIRSCLGTGPDGLMTLLPEEKKHRICQKINNKTKI